jgi:translation initiation factor 1
MKKNNRWKSRLGIVYSTNPDFSYNVNGEKPDTLPPEKQTLRIQLSTKQRNGKTVTLITGFIGKPDDLRILEKELKSRCATGGSTKDNEIIIQGDFRETAADFLQSKGYKIKGL